MDKELWSGGIIWYTDWGIRGDQEIGFRLIERIRLGYGFPQQFATATVQWHRADERLDVAGVLLQSMLFGWDTYYVPRWAAGGDDFFVFISHDGYVEVNCRNDSAKKQALELIQSLGFQPELPPNRT